MIEPLDENERQQLLDELLVERFGRRPRRPSGEASAQTVAERRRVLCGYDRKRAA